MCFTAREIGAATQPLSHSARVAGAATQPLSHSAKVAAAFVPAQRIQWIGVQDLLPRRISF